MPPSSGFRPMQDVFSRMIIMLMLQSQQDIGLLQKILEKQTLFEFKHQDFEKKLTDLETRVEASHTTPSSSNESGKRKRIVSRTLSIS